jgi:DUF4097 and DUF4098 domain-containing protein YvlB
MPKFTAIAATLGFLVAGTLSASAKIDRTVEKSFQVQPGAHLKVSTSGGEISVEPSSDGMVKIVAKEHIRASSDAEADELLEKLDLVIEQNGNEIVAKATYKSNTGFHFGSWPPVNVDFIIAAPRSTSADLATSGGDIRVGSLDGELKAHTSGGEIKLAKMGGEIDASTSGGNVELELGRSSVKLSTSGGTISAGRLMGPSELKTSGGDIKIDAVENTISAHTSGGDVKAVFEGALKGDCSLDTSGGDVKATVGQGIGFHLVSSTSGGDVKADGLSITIDHGGVGRSSLSGKVNGGGPTLNLHTSGGDVVIAVR